MLPDYPKVKKELLERLEEFLRERTQHNLGLLGKIPKVRVFEGDSQVLVRASGELAPVDFQEHRAGFRVADAEVPTMTMEALLRRFDEVARDMARQMAEMLFKTVSDAVEEVGNVVNGQGQRLSAPLILDLLTKLQVEFGPDGEPQLPQIYIPPNLEAAAEQALTELQTDPSLQAQFRRIIEAKRREWRAREADRKLVG